MVVWTLVAHFNPKKYREPQEGLSKIQSTAILFLPLVLTIFCVALTLYIPGITTKLPFYALLIIFFLGRLGIPESVSIPLKMRQVASQLIWGVVISFIFLIIVSGVSDLLGP